MSNKKISELSSAAKPLSGLELAVMNQNGSTVTAILSDIREYVTRPITLSAAPTTGSLYAKTQNVNITTPAPADDVSFYTLTINASTANYAMGYSLSGNNIYIDHGAKASMKCNLFPGIPLFYAGVNSSGEHEWTDRGLLFDEYINNSTAIVLRSKNGDTCYFFRISAFGPLNEAATTTTTEWPDGQTFTASIGANPSFSAIPITSSALANIIYVNLVGSYTFAFTGAYPWYAPETYINPVGMVNLVTVGTAGVLNQDAIVSKSDVYKCVRTAPYCTWVQLYPPIWGSPF